MRRRQFITLLGGAAASPLAARAQQAGKIRAIGLLSPASRSPSVVPALFDALAELGWIEGKNLVVERRYAENRLERLPELAAELVRLNVEVIVATGTLGRAQLDALETVLVDLAAERAFRVLLVHHPLRSDSRPKRLTDSSQLIALIERHGVDLILHGHDHIHSTMWFDGPERQIPSIGVPAASALARGRHPAAAYNLFAIARDGNAWRCEQTVRGFGDHGSIRKLKQVRLS